MARSASRNSGGSGTNTRAGGEELQNALRAALEVLHGGRVGDPEEARSVERFAGRQRDVRVVEERRGQVRGGPVPVRRQELADVREHVERTGRLLQADAWIGRQPFVEPIAP